MRVAFVHDWLTGMRGGERCLLSFLRLYPDADIFTLLHQPGASAVQIDAAVKGTSFLQKLPGIGHYYRAMMPLYPLAAASISLSGYDLVISLSHAAAKNVRVERNALHLCYCFTPMRYIWDQSAEYFGALRFPLWPLLHGLRVWDRRGAEGVDDFIAISRFVASRVRQYYHRSADVVFPPVDLTWVSPHQDENQAGEAFLYAGALVPYKRPDLVVQACTQLNLPLWIIGSGSEEARLRRMAGPTVQFLGPVGDDELAHYYRRSRALVFPGKEDFGMIPVECMGAGRPVIALDAGGARETVHGIRPWQNGHSPDFDEATGVFIRRGRGDRLKNVIAALRFFLDHEGQFSTAACRRQAEQFSEARFQKDWLAVVSRVMEVAGERTRDVEAETAAL